MLKAGVTRLHSGYVVGSKLSPLMKKLIELIRSLWWGPIVSVITALAILAFRDSPPNVEGAAFDYVGAFAFGLLIAGILWLMLYATDVERCQDLDEKSRRTSTGKSSVASVTTDSSISGVAQELASRIKEAADFKAAIERKNAELDTLRSKLNRKDLVAVNEAIAALYQSVEFLCERAATGKESPDKVLPQIAEAADELLASAQLEKGLPKPGERLADLPPNSCTIFNRIPAPTPEQKGLLVEVRNSWLGFRSDAQLVIVNPSRVSVYV